MLAQYLSSQETGNVVSQTVRPEEGEGCVLKRRIEKSKASLARNNGPLRQE